MTDGADSRDFVLVHGGCHGGWCWSRVAERLRRAGHRVFTPTLTGLGERSHLLSPQVNCSTHIQDVANVIRWEQLHNVVLCGHSYAGVIVMAVADIMPERIGALVMVDGAILRSGETALGTLGNADISWLVGKTAMVGDVEVLPPPPAIHYNVNPADRAMVDALCTPQPVATVTEQLLLTGAHEAVTRRTFIRATDWQGPTESYQRIKDDPSWSILDIACGHDAMLDAPEDLARLLVMAS